MKKLIIFLILFSYIGRVISQNKMGNTWIVGIHKMPIAEFNGIQPPNTVILKTNAAIGYPFDYFRSHSNISDSSTGKLLFSCNAMRIYDTSGALMQNGDSLQPLKIYTMNNPPSQPVTQGSLILPKGNSGEYYVFVTTVSDSLYDALWVPDIRTPFDELRYNVVNMNLNGGLGTVTAKNKSLLIKTEMIRTMMQACRHANGTDWWLLKQMGPDDNNKIARFLVTKDSIYGPYYQYFSTPNWGFDYGVGQLAFSKDGKRYAAVHSKSNKLFVADFDRCSGELSNPKVFNIPLDSTTIPNPQPQYVIDTGTTGVCFSPNGKFAYITKRYNIYQFEFDEPDSSLAWSLIQHGPDTTHAKFEYYGQLLLGPDERIYIGKGGGTHRQFSVIDYPNNKGLACGFCKKCFRLPDSSFTATTSPPNMPDYTLGADLTKVCWPLSIDEIRMEGEKLEVFPNPANAVINIKTEIIGKRELYNSVGQLLIVTNLNEIDVRKYSKGIYYIKVGNTVRKIIIE